MLNRCEFIGRLGKDVDVRYTPGGAMVVNFSIATDEKWKDKNGDKQQRTEWIKIQVWNKLAEICANYLTKGSMVWIEGKMQTRSWEDKDGTKRYTTEIIGSKMVMLGGGTKQGNAQHEDNFDSHGDFNPDDVKILDDVPF